MKFTQFMFPSGHARPVYISMPNNIEMLAQELIDKGWAFEIECFPETQMVNMDCSDDYVVLNRQLCKNGPNIPNAVEELVLKAHKMWESKGRPEGNHMSKCNNCDRTANPQYTMNFDDIGQPPLHWCDVCGPEIRAMSIALERAFKERGPEFIEKVKLEIDRAEEQSNERHNRS